MTCPLKGNSQLSQRRLHLKAQEQICQRDGEKYDHTVIFSAGNETNRDFNLSFLTCEHKEMTECKIYNSHLPLKSFTTSYIQYMCAVCVLFQPFNNAHSQPCRPASGGGGKKKHHESKGPFPNPHKLHVTWLQWDDYTLLARILWRLLTGPHYIDSHLWLNVSTSFLPVCMCDLPAITAAGGRGGG